MAAAPSARSQVAMLMAICQVVCAFTLKAPPTTTLVPTTNTTAITASAFSSTTTTAFGGCGDVARCLGDPQCKSCLRAINVSSSLFPHSIREFFGLSLADNRANEAAIARSLLATVSCSTNNTPAGILHPALQELEGGICVGEYGMALNTCSSKHYACMVDHDCRECLMSVYLGSNDTKSDAFNSSACALVDSSLMAGVVEYCASFPDCTLSKYRCGGLVECARCLDTLVEGHGAQAARQCPSSEPSGLAADFVVSSCFERNQVTCGFHGQRCAENDNCWACLGNMLDADDSSIPAIATAWSTSSCKRVMQDPIAIKLLQRVLSGCPIVGSCSIVISVCIGDAADACLECVSEPSDHVTPGCDQLLQSFDVYHACHACSDSVTMINHIVLATAVVGGVSVMMCLAVVVTVVAHGRDRVSLRERLVIGLLLANCVYSIANSIPFNLLHTGTISCGRLVMPFETIRIGRALWFGGKYGLVSFELFIVGASIHALLRGRSAVPLRIEVFLNFVCWLAAVLAFVCFHVLCSDINAAGYNEATESNAFTNTFNHGNPDDDLDDDTPSETAELKFQAGRQAYDNLVRQMLVVWDILVGVAVVMWFVLRLMHRHVQEALRSEKAAVRSAERADSWAATRRSAWTARQKVLEAQRDAFAEVTKPLEPYLLVFVVFAVPAVVMSTSYCQDMSGAYTRLELGSVTDVDATTFSYGTCDAWCELVLAFRTLATIAVYLCSRERRADLVGVRLTFRKLRGRIAGCCRCSQDTCTARPTVGGAHQMHEVSRELDNHFVDDDSWRIDERDITLLRHVGKGAFGQVWEARFKMQLGTRTVAVKMISVMRVVDEDGDVVDPNADDDFFRECAALQRIDNPHLLKFFGCGSTSAGSKFIVTELMVGGPLDELLHDTQRRLPWRLRVAIGLQIALGMEHLHGRHMLHRDLKPANVLLDQHQRAKVCDFGLSRVVRPPRECVVHSPFTGKTRFLPTTHSMSVGNRQSATSFADIGVTIEDVRGTMTRATGTVLYMAPEVFRGDQDYGTAVDVYSFGIVLWELATREIPWSQLSSNATVFFTLLNHALQTGRRPTVPTDVTDAFPQFVTVMKQCWQGDPADRPSFADAANDLSACLREVRDVEDS